MPAIAHSATDEDQPSPELPLIKAAVLRVAWTHRTQHSVFPDGVARDLLHGRTLPPPGASLIVKHLTVDLRLEVLQRIPNEEDHVTSKDTRIHVVPALPPSLAFTHSNTSEALNRFVDGALDGRPLAPIHTLLVLPHGSERAAAAATCTAAARRGAAVLRFAPPDLGVAYGARGVRAALKAALAAARDAAPSVLLFDNVHLLAPPALRANAAALALAMRSAAVTLDQARIAIILLAAPDEQALHTLVCEEVHATIEYRPIDTRPSLNTSFAQMRITDSAKWEEVNAHVGANTHAKEALEHALAWRRTRESTFIKLGVRPPAGVLLYGAPGTGKTLVVRAGARSANFALRTVDAARLARGAVGASERLLRTAFEEAQTSSPCVLFIDEVDALFATGGDAAAARLIATLASCMDATSNGTVVIVAATNRPWRVAPALLRAGRFDRVVHTALPTSAERGRIADVYAKKMRLSAVVAVALRETAAGAQGLSGADIAGACRRAAMQAIARDDEIGVDDIEMAFLNTKRSVSAEAETEIASWNPHGKKFSDIGKGD